MDLLLEKVFPYEGIPEIMLSFFTPEELHEKVSEKSKQNLELKYKKVVTLWGQNTTYFNHQPHSFNGEPAHIYQVGINKTEEWYRYGKRHREGGNPAVSTWYGKREWWIDGQQHREGDNPAVIDSDGTQEWWIYGMRHRDGDLPAYITLNMEAWYQYNQMHRDGNKPAFVMPASHYKEWWIHGVFIRKLDGNVYKN